MAAVFMTLADGGIFQHSVGSTANLVKCTLTNDLAGKNSTIITGVSVAYNETVQFFQSFDDLIHYFYFGQGLGSIHFDLVCFQTCRGRQNFPGLDQLMRSIGGVRGKPVSVDIGSQRVTGVLTDFALSVTAEPVPMINVSINLGMIKNGLRKPDIPGAC